MQILIEVNSEEEVSAVKGYVESQELPVEFGTFADMRNFYKTKQIMVFINTETKSRWWTTGWDNAAYFKREPEYNSFTFLSFDQFKTKYLK